MKVRVEDGVGEEEVGEVARSRENNVPVEIIQHNQLQGKEVGQWEIILDENIELGEPRNIAIFLLYFSSEQQCSKAY